jgi:hypothetical protein
MVCSEDMAGDFVIIQSEIHQQNSPAVIMIIIRAKDSARADFGVWASWWM